MTTEVLTVPTAFGDLSELSEGLADRVDDERIILYGPTPYDEGELIGFSVLLVDGTPALEGVGRVAEVADGGDERAPETRFDIVFDSLQLDGRSEVVYERIVLARSSMYGTEPATGEVSIEELEAQSREFDGPADFGTSDHGDFVAAPAEAFASFDDDVAGVDELMGTESVAAVEDAAEVAFSEPPPAPMSVRPAMPSARPAMPSERPATPSVRPPMPSVRPAPVEAVFDDEGGYDEAGFAADGFDAGSGSTMVADLEQLRAAAQPSPSIAPAPALPSAPPGFLLQAPPGGVLTRPMAPPTWWPAATAAAQPRPSTGWFQYGDALPVPSEPPRPELDPVQRVSPAPRPGDALQPPSPPSVMPPLMVGRVDEPAETPAYLTDAPYAADGTPAPNADLNEDLPNEDLPNGDPNEDLPNEDLPNGDLPNGDLPNEDLPNGDPNEYGEPESLDADADEWAGVDLGEDEDLAGDTRHAFELPEDDQLS